MSKRHRDDAIDLSDTTEVVSMLWLAASYLEARGYKPRRGDEKLGPISIVWNVLQQFKTQYQKHYANDAEEVERCGFFKKLKARVTKHDDQSKNIIMQERIWINRLINETTSETHCEATGHFPPVRQHRNVDDCRVHTCGPHGTCVDGVNSDSCYCDPGFQETEADRLYPHHKYAQNLSYSLKVNEFASLTTSEFVSQYKGR